MLIPQTVKAEDQMWISRRNTSLYSRRCDLGTKGGSLTSLLLSCSATAFASGTNAPQLVLKIGTQGNTQRRD